MYKESIYNKYTIGEIARDWLYYDNFLLKDISLALEHYSIVNGREGYFNSEEHCYSFLLALYLKDTEYHTVYAQKYIIENVPTTVNKDIIHFKLGYKLPSFGENNADNLVHFPSMIILCLLRGVSFEQMEEYLLEDCEISDRLLDTTHTYKKRLYAFDKRFETLLNMIELQ